MSLVDRYRRAVEPAADGLPNRRVILVPLALAGLVLGFLVAMGITGSSTGQAFILSHGPKAHDPQLILGSSKGIRSDEWFVQTTWSISQVEQGLPPVNRTFPGGMNATVEHDMPTTDWSTAFRPHLWGFLVLPLDNAMALKWWLPAASMVVLGYLFIVTLLPRRPGAALALSIGFYFAPFFQWWFLSITFWPVAFAFAVMTAAVWMIRRGGWRQATTWTLLCSYLAVTTGMGIYAPYIIPCVLVAVAFVLGVVADGLGTGLRVRNQLTRLLPLVSGGVAAGAVLAVWALTRLDAIRAFTDTVYPGARVTPPGTAASWGAARAIFSAPTSYDLADPGLFSAIGSNSSEASSFFLIGFLLLPAALWLLWLSWRSGRRVDAVLLACLVVSAVMVAFDFVPGWHLLATLLTLDRTTPPRIQIGFGLAALVITVVVAWRLERPHDSEDGALAVRIPSWVIVAVAGVVVLVNVVVVIAIDRAKAGSWSPGLVALGVTAFFCISVVLVAASRITYAAVAFLVVSLISGFGVNPFYRGVYDLNHTKVGHAVERTEARSPGSWVAFGLVPTMALVESGVTAYSGFQASPPQTMWRQIDPSGQYEHTWNRLALVSWVAGAGDPIPARPPGTFDQIHVTFDSCNAFAQRHVHYVLSEIDVPQPCLQRKRIIRMGQATYRIYRVIPPAPASASG